MNKDARRSRPLTAPASVVNFLEYFLVHGASIRLDDVIFLPLEVQSHLHTDTRKVRTEKRL